MLDVLGIRFTKLHFILELLEDGTLPVSKESAIRGGIGEMLLRYNCLREDRNCVMCDFETECIVQRMMYSRLEIQPEFMTRGDSVGYVIECEDYRKHFHKGDMVRCNVLLFGKNIAYKSQYIQVLEALGEHGIGRENLKFRVVINRKNSPVRTVQDYVNHRMEQIEGTTLQNRMIFYTPLTQKYQQEFLQEFHMGAITKSIQRRIYILNCFEGKDVEAFYRQEYEVPEILSQTVKSVKVKRYSNRHQSSMVFKGIKGSIQLQDIPEELLELYLAGELLHIGKNTSFGFGRYAIQ